MKILKTDQFLHGGLGIFSIDVQPGDRRFATGGSAENGSGLVIIWNFRNLVESRNGTSNAVTVPAILLCRLENHLGCVNCVRWSESGKFLASGGDDSVIQIVQFAGKITSAVDDNLSTNDGKNAKNVELWKCVHTLRGHSSDVLHVSWSPNDLYLASCSIDNQVIIWHGQTFEKISTLSGHSGPVKGITWDPVGKYLASQSDDKSVRIWFTSNWTLTKEIRDPFQNCGATTQFLRLDWSPDGSVIATAHAMNNEAPVSKLITREFIAEQDFLGHRKAITCVRWSPCMYENTKDSSGKASVPHCVCAIGSKDRSFSIWSTKFKRPVGVVEEAFSQPIIDLSWNRTGRYLLACSSDGTILCATFRENELGRIMPQSEKIELLRRTYGKHGPLAMSNGHTNGHDASTANGSANFVIDTPEVAKLHHATTKASGAPVEPKKPVQNGISSAAKNALPNGVPPPPVQQQKQIEIKNKDGKRRIQPVFLGAAVVTEDDLAPPIADEQSKSIETTAAQPIALAEIADGQPSISAAAASSAAPSHVSAAPSTSKQSDLSLDGRPKSQEQADKQIVRKDSSASSRAQASSSRPVQVKRKQGEAPTSHPSKKGRQQKEPSQQKKNRRTILSESEEDDDEGAEPVVERELDKETPAVDQPSSSTGSSHISAVSLQVPAKLNVLTVTVDLGDKEATKLEISVQNGIRIVSNGALTASLVVTQSKSTLWRTIIGAEVLALAASPSIIAVVGCDRRMNVFKTNVKTSLSPPIVLDSNISVLRVDKSFVLCLTSFGTVQLWDFKNKFKCLCKSSVYPLIADSKTTIQRCYLRADGVVILIRSDGKSFTYNLEMECWLAICDPENPLTAASVARSALAGRQEPIGPLHLCIRNGAQLSQSKGHKISSSAGGDATLAVAAYLESQVRSAVELRSSQEFHFWYMQYVQYLVKEGCGGDLKELCQDLMNSTLHASTNSMGDGASILGHSKFDLLKEVLPMIAGNPKLQRVYTEMKARLAMTNNEDGHEAML